MHSRKSVQDFVRCTLPRRKVVQNKTYLRPQEAVFLIDLDQIKPGHIHAEGARKYDKELSHY